MCNHRNGWSRALKLECRNHWLTSLNQTSCYCICLVEMKKGANRTMKMEKPLWRLHVFDNESLIKSIWTELKTKEYVWCQNKDYVGGATYKWVVSTIMSGLLFPHKNPAKQVTKVCSFLLWLHSWSKKKSSWVGKLIFKGWGYYFPRTLSPK